MQLPCTDIIQWGKKIKFLLITSITGQHTSLLTLNMPTGPPSIRDEETLLVYFKKKTSMFDQTVSTILPVQSFRKGQRSHRGIRETRVELKLTQKGRWFMLRTMHKLGVRVGDSTSVSLTISTHIEHVTYWMAPQKSMRQKHLEMAFSSIHWERV